MNKNELLQLLPPEFQNDCRIGICDPRHIDRAEPAYEPCEKKWSARSDDILADTAAIVVLRPSNSDC